MRQRMATEEAEAVARLHLEREGAEGVSAAELAETLGTTEARVAELLAEVRDAPQRAHARAVAEHRRRDLRRVAAAFVFAVLIAGGGFAFYRSRQPKLHFDPSDFAPTNAQDMIADTTRAAQAASDMAVTPVEGTVTEAQPDEPSFPTNEMVAPDGVLPQIRLDSGPKSRLIPVTGQSLDQILGEIETEFGKRAKPMARSQADDGRTLGALDRHETRDPGLARVPVMIYTGRNGPWPTLYLPLYTGANDLVARRTAEARKRILSEALGINMP